MRSEQSYERQRKAGFLCHARRYANEETVKRVIWAIKLNGRGNDKLVPRRCRTCGGWHIARSR